MAVAKDDHCRFQAECLDEVHYSGDRKWIIRSTQVHSNAIGRQMRDVDAYETVNEWAGVTWPFTALDSTCYQPSLGWGPQDSCPEG